MDKSHKKPENKAEKLRAALYTLLLPNKSIKLCQEKLDFGNGLN